MSMTPGGPEYLDTTGPANAVPQDLEIPTDAETAHARRSRWSWWKRR